MLHHFYSFAEPTESGANERNKNKNENENFGWTLKVCQTKILIHI